MVRNNKGFMLAEVVIVAAVLITTMVALYAGFVKVFKAYDERGNYYDTDSLYALRNIQDFLVDNMSLNTALKNINSTTPFMYVKNSDTISTNMTLSDYEKNYFKEVMDEYNLEYVILTLYTKEKVEKINADTITNEFAFYLSTNLDFTEDAVESDDENETYNYIFISEKKDGKCAYLRGV